MITSKDNSRIKKAAQLGGSARKRRETGLFVLEGSRLCGEALRENLRVCELFYTADAKQSHPELIAGLCEKAEFADEVSEAVFAKLSDTCSPQGVLLTAAFIRPLALPSSGRFIAFEQVSDPANLGAAARTAEALGFAGLILSRSGVDPFAPKPLRASMGALLRLPLVYADDFYGTLAGYQVNGFTVNGTVVEPDAQPLNSVSFGTNEIAVIGNEANGLTAGMRAQCDRLITIPMPGRAESLNAAAAAAIVMWEMSR